MIASNKAPRLFVALFDQLDRSNFPAGHFERRVLSNREARQRIDDARSLGQLCGVSADDLSIDNKALLRAEELLEALASLADPIRLTIEDFIRRRHFVPLQVVVVGPDVELLVVSCRYGIGGAADRESVFNRTSISFDLFSASG